MTLKPEQIKKARIAKFSFKKMLPLWSILLKLDEVDYMNACNMVEDLIDEALEQRERDWKKAFKIHQEQSGLEHKIGQTGLEPIKTQMIMGSFKTLHRLTENITNSKTSK